MLKVRANHLVALTIALTAVDGCARQANLAQAPVGQALKPATTSDLFHGSLKASSNAATSGYGLLALLQPAHLIGAPFKDSSNSFARQYDAQLAYNPQNDTYLAAWTQGNEVFGRIEDAHGVPVVPLFLITTNGFTEPDYKAAYLPWVNEFAVVYTRSLSATDTDVFMQRLSATGAMVGNAIPISTAGGAQKIPDLAVDPVHGNVEVVWQDNCSGDLDIYGRLVNCCSGATLYMTPEMVIGSSAPNPANQEIPTIAFGTQQQVYVVAWEDGRNRATSGEDIYGTVLNNKGLPTKSNFPIATTPGDQFDAEIAYMPATDRFLLVYDSGPSGSAPVDILGSGLDGGGTVLGSGIVDNAPGRQYYPAVAANPATMTWLVAFTDDGPTEGVSSNISGRHIGSYYQLGDIFPITPSDPDIHKDAAIGANTVDQQFLVDFEDAASTTAASSIEGQLVDRGF